MFHATWSIPASNKHGKNKLFESCKKVALASRGKYLKTPYLVVVAELFLLFFQVMLNS